MIINNKIYNAIDLVQYGRMKNLNINKHLIKEKIDFGIICNLYVKSENKELTL